MKIFQIVNEMCYYDATNNFSTIEEAIGKVPEDVILVEAPDYVFQDWGYDETKEGDERFIKPTAPEGWLYDDETGTFYKEGDVAPSKRPTQEQQIALLKAQVEAQSQQLDFYEECIAEMATVVYAE